MKKLVNNFLRSAMALALFSGMVFVLPANLQAKPKGSVKVDVTVTVHGSDIGVSTDVMEESVEKLLEAAEVIIVPEGDGEGIIELEIDIYKNDDGGFRVDCDWDDDDETEAQQMADTQDEIDNIVEGIVDSFIDFIGSIKG
ncbi:MAG: hypothetical protein IPJ30_03330 [Acidobacteria bacterium]|nr:hypothetical protein [Acidobacteriota bacterium]